MPYTVEELAFQLKQQDPLYSKYSNEELVQAALQKFPELKSEVVDLGGPTAGAATTEGMSGPIDLEAIKARAEGEAGTGFASALKGAGKGALGTAAGLADIALPGEPATEALGGAIVPSNPEEAVGSNVAEMASFFLPTGITKLAQIPGLAKSPWLLRLVAAAAEGAKSGGLTAAQGGSPLATGLMSMLGAGVGALGTAAGGLERSASRNVARAVGADITQAEPVLQVAPQALDEGFMGTRSALGRTAEGRMREATAAKSVLEQSQAPVDLSGVAAELAKRGGERTLTAPAVHPNLTPEVLADIGAMLQDPRMGPSFVQNQVLPGLGATMDDFKQALAAMKAPTTGDPQFVGALAKEADDVGALNEAWLSEVPLSEAVKFAKGKGAVTRRTRGAFSEIPGQELSAGTEAGKETAGLLKEAVHGVSPALKDADQKYHVYRTLKDALDKAGLRDLTTSQQMRFAEYILGRMAVGAAVGGASGATDSPLFNVAGGALLGLGSRTALVQTMSGTFKRRLAAAIKNGSYDTAFSMIESLPALANERNLPRAPEE